MKYRTIFVLLSLVLIIGLLVVACAQPAPAPAPTPTPAPPAEVFKLRMQSSGPAGTPIHEGQQAAVDYLNRVGKGRLEVSLYPVGTFVSITQTIEAVASGAFEACFDIPAFGTPLDPGFSPIFGLPALWESPTQVHIWLEKFGGKEIVSKAYAGQGVHYVGSLVEGAEVLMSKKPLRTLDDLNGQILRTVPGLTFDLFEKLGAKPLTLGGSEIYSALETGVIDAAEWTMAADDYAMGFHEVTDYVLWPSFHQPIGHAAVIVNQDVWDKLPEDLQVAFELMTMAASDYYEYWIMAADYEAIEKMVDYGLELCTLSEADWARAKKLGREVAEAYKAKSPLANEVISSSIDFLRYVRVLD